MKRDIEEAVRKLHQALWRDAKARAQECVDPVSLLNPANVARVLGVTLEYLPAIRDTHSGYRTAGMMLRDQNRIVVSEENSPGEVRFTVAHELGHYVLHPDARFFRDRPVRRLAQTEDSRPTVEAEADHFAACLLMPAKLVRVRFEQTFAVKTPYVFSDAWAFYLCQEDPNSLLFDEDAERNRAFALAKARSFNGKPIRPLHEQFGVSSTAMAYRLLELKLVGNGDPHEEPEAASKAASMQAHPLLPSGLHVIEEHQLEEVLANPFPNPARRIELLRSFRAFIAFLRQIGITCEIWIDGSMATDKPEPGDIDVAVFIYPGQIGRLSLEQVSELDLLNDRPLMSERYACDVYVERANDNARRDYFLRTFGDHYGTPKGIPVVRIYD